jgi:hypothetical protein
MQKIQSVKLFILGLVFILSGFLASCNDNFEDYSGNPQDCLAFSTDTLSFDTVLTAVNSPVKIFMVYNHNRRPLLISSIRLAEGASSNFKINVDGFAGSEFKDIEIRENDSIYILVDVKPAETGLPGPAMLDDYIVFTTHQSVQQKVVLQAYGQDVYKYQGLVLAADTVLSNSKPFLIYDSLVIEEGATAEIREGATFYMGNNAQIIVKGKLKVKGSLDKPVTFRGSRTDYLLGYLPYDLLPGQWGGIRFDSLSYDNEFENVRIRNNKFGIKFSASEPYREKIKMKNVVLTNVSGILIQAVNCNIIAENCEFSNAKDYLLKLCGGRYRFTHCTIANYYPRVSSESGWGIGDSKTVYLTDEIIYDWDSSEHYPVLGFEAYNSIIAGNMPSSAISISMKEEPSGSLNFLNCVFTNKKVEKNYINYTDCIAGAIADSLFKKVNYENGKHQFWPVYDFGLMERSPARNVACLEISKLIPMDMKGVNRMDDGFPDAGAYEFIAESE